ncbi:uncharacterized protein LOC100204624 isoform X2 [Hydra vulgaris]|uniref:Uncharacterized protein LOC100204624 isoform X2 n=1 Tax=Hydra vulgaris TaxID=6087 RepID=A0ABM4BLW8_HYDVU
MKRKITNESPVHDGICSPKKVNETRWSDQVHLIQEQLIIESSSVAALKDFVKYSLEESNFVEAYLLTSRECKEIFYQFGTDQRPDSLKLTLIWEAFECVLLWTSDQALDSNLKSTGLFIVNKVLQNHIKLLYSSLSVNASTDLVIAVLKCMAVMLAQGSTAVSEFVSCFDFSLKGLKFHAKKRIKKLKPDPRTCFVRFLLAFFVFGDVSALLKMLEEKTVDNLNIFAKDLVSLVFDDINQDSPEVIGAVLNTFLQNVVEESSLLKKMKIIFFSSSVLFKLALLCKHNEESISSVALSMLEILCTNQRKGICFGSKKDEPFTGKLLNPVLLKFLTSIKQHALLQKNLLDLTIKTLKICPDVVAPYIGSIDLQMEPKCSEQWHNKINFTIEIMKNVPKVSDILTDSNKVKPDKEYFFKILIPPMPKRHYEAGIKNASSDVLLKTLDLLIIVLSRCVDFKEMFSALLLSEEKQLDWIDSLIQSLPDIIAVIKVRQTLGPQGPQGIVEKEQQSNVLERSIECLYLFQVLKPGIISDSGYNICKLLIFTNNEISASIVGKSLQILLLENTSVRSWLDKKMSGYKSFLHLLLQVALQWKHEISIVNCAKMLFFKVLNITNQFDELYFEISTWLSYLLNQEESLGCEIFATSCLNLLHDPFALSNFCVDEGLLDGLCEENKQPCSTLSINMLSLLSGDLAEKVVAPVLQTFVACSKEPKKIVKFVSKISSVQLESFFTFSKQWIDLIEKTNSNKIYSNKEDVIMQSNVVEMVYRSALMLSYISSKDIKDILNFFLTSQQLFVKEISEMPLHSLTNYILPLFFNIITVLNHSDMQPIVISHIDSVLKTSFQTMLSKISNLGGTFASISANLIIFQTSFVKEFLNWKDLISQTLAYCLQQFPELKTHHTEKPVNEFVNGLVDLIFQMRKKISQEANMMAVFGILKNIVAYLPSFAVVELLKKVTCDLFSVEQCSKVSSSYIYSLNSLLVIINENFFFKEILSDLSGLNDYLHECLKRKNKNQTEQRKCFLLIYKYFPTLNVSYKILCKMLKLGEKIFQDAALLLSKQNIKWVDSMVTEIDHQNFSVTDNLVYLLPLLSIASNYKLLTEDQHKVVGNILKIHLEKILNSKYPGFIDVLVWLQTFLSLDEKAEFVKVIILNLENEENLILYIHIVSSIKEHKKYAMLLLDGVAQILLRIINSKDRGVFEHLQPTLELISQLDVKKYSTKLKTLASLWNEFVTVIVKNYYAESKCINLLSMAVSLFYKIKKFQDLNVLTLKELYSMFISHSMFLQVMQKEDIVKESLVKFLLTLVKLSPDLCSHSFVPILLASYGASLSNCDQYLLSLLMLFEESGVSFEQFQPLLWGAGALDAYRTDKPKHLMHERVFSSFLNQIDSKRLIQTAWKFPIHLKLTDECFKASELYDPRFLLTLLACFFKPGFFVDCRQFIEGGCLSLVIASLSSHDESIRKVAYYILSQYNDQLENSKFREKSQVMYLLMLLKNSIISEFMQIPCVWTMLFIQYLYFVLRPGQHMYPILSNCILLKPIINMKEMPFFLPLFNSSSSDHRQERIWLLRLLADSLKDLSDFYLYKKYHVFEMIIAYHDSLACSAADRDVAVALIRSACFIQVASYDLIKTYSICSWIHANLKRIGEAEKYLNLLYLITKTFVKNDALTCSPRLYLSEALLISLSGLQICHELSQRSQLDVLYVLSKLVSNSGYFGDMVEWICKDHFLLMLTLSESLVLSPSFIDEDLNEVYSTILIVIISKSILDLPNLVIRPWKEIKVESDKKHYASITDIFKNNAVKTCGSDQLLIFLRSISF